jgi:hypothetical protein
MRKLFLLCSFAVVLTGCAPSRDPVFGARDERTFPDPALGIKNPESETYSTQIMASPPSSPAAAVQSAPVTHKQIPAPGK